MYWEICGAIHWPGTAPARAQADDPEPKRSPPWTGAEPGQPGGGKAEPQHETQPVLRIEDEQRPDHRGGADARAHEVEAIDAAGRRAEGGEREADAVRGKEERHHEHQVHGRQGEELRRLPHHRQGVEGEALDQGESSQGGEREERRVGLPSRY